MFVFTLMSSFLLTYPYQKGDRKSYKKKYYITINDRKGDNFGFITYTFAIVCGRRFKDVLIISYFFYYKNNHIMRNRIFKTY